MPSNSVRCQGIDDAATKVDRSSGGLTGEGLLMASSPKSVANCDPATNSKATRYRNLSPPNRSPLRARFPQQVITGCSEIGWLSLKQVRRLFLTRSNKHGLSYHRTA